MLSILPTHWSTYAGHINYKAFCGKSLTSVEIAEKFCNRFQIYGVILRSPLERSRNISFPSLSLSPSKWARTVHRYRKSSVVQCSADGTVESCKSLCKLHRMENNRECKGGNRMKSSSFLLHLTKELLRPGSILFLSSHIKREEVLIWWLLSFISLWNERAAAKDDRCIDLTSTSYEYKLSLSFPYTVL